MRLRRFSALMLIILLHAGFAFSQELTPAEQGIERLPQLEEPLPPPEEFLAGELVPGAPPLAPAIADAIADAEPEEVLAESEDVPVVVEPVVTPIKLWSGSFDLGLNGSEGNTQLFNMRFNLAAIRETERAKLTLKSNYVRTHTESSESANRLFFEGRNEWKLGDSPWSIYVHETTEYDEFQPWRTRVGMDTGLGTKLIQNDHTSLTLRAGPSTSHEFRGVNNDEWVPEIAYGLQLEHKLTQLQKLFFQIDYFPDVRDVADYRMNTQASWEIVIDKVNNLSLKLSAISRYDSTPDNGTPDDLDYAATLLWAF